MISARSQGRSPGALARGVPFGFPNSARPGVIAYAISVGPPGRPFQDRKRASGSHRGRPIWVTVQHGSESAKSKDRKPICNLSLTASGVRVAALSSSANSGGTYQCSLSEW